MRQSLSAILSSCHRNCFHQHPFPLSASQVRFAIETNEDEAIFQQWVKYCAKMENVTETDSLFSALHYLKNEILERTANDNRVDYLFFTTDTIRYLHAALFKNGGRWRKNRARPLGYPIEYVPPDKIEELMFAFVDTYNQKVLDTLKIESNKKRVTHIIELAAFFMSRFLYIHPLYDGNGRTTRRKTSSRFNLYLSRRLPL